MEFIAILILSSFSFILSFLCFIAVGWLWIKFKSYTETTTTVQMPTDLDGFAKDVFKGVNELGLGFKQESPVTKTNPEDLV